MHADLPVLEDPASYGYFREEVGGLMVGLFEPVCAPWNVDGMPDDFSFGELPPDWDRMGPYVETAMQRVPVLDGHRHAEVLLRAGELHAGPAADRRRGARAEELLRRRGAELDRHPHRRRPRPRAGALDRQRSIPTSTSPASTSTGCTPTRRTPSTGGRRTVESLGMVYQCHYPTRSMQTARGAKRSPFHDRLAARGAYFRTSAAGRAPTGTRRPGVEPAVERLSWGRQSWFPYWEAEHRAAREGVILMDMSFMAKFLVQGRDAGALLNCISANDVDGDAGVDHLHAVAQRARASSRPTSRSPSSTTIASGSSRRTPRTATPRRGCGGTSPTTAHAFVTDVTSGYAQINVQGPRSRELLQPLTTADLSNDAFPFRTAREIDIGFARVLCIRITYLGELGYELYIPAEQAMHVYDRLVDAGEPVGLRHAGLKALASLRMEKGYRDYGHDIDNTDSVLEAGLGFAVDLDKPGGFIGQEAVLAQEGRGRADAAARPDPAERSRAADVPRGDRAAQRHAGRLRPRRVVRVTRSAARSGSR